MLRFKTEGYLTNYRISPHEVDAELIAYVEESETYWRPVRAGVGLGLWKQLSGSQRTRAVGDTAYALEPTSGGRDASRTIVAGLLETVHGEMVGEGSITLDGEILFVLPADGLFVGPGEVKEVYGPLTLDGQGTLDGEVIQWVSREELDLPMVKQEVSAGTRLTVPLGYQLPYSGTMLLNGEMYLEGEVA